MSMVPANSDALPDLHTYRAFSPKSFRYRVQYCEDYFDFGWRLVIEDGKIRREGQSKNHGRAHVMQHLIEPFAQYLPDMTMWVRGHVRSLLSTLCQLAEQKYRTRLRSGEAGKKASAFDS